MSLRPSSQPSAAAPWKTRFFAIWGGQALSLIGSSLTQFVLMWWITSTTGSAKALSIAGIAVMFPLAVIGPFAGALVDRLDRRLVMIAADTVTALAMLGLVLLFAGGRVELWQVYSLMFLRSTMQAFQSPAAKASTSLLVPAAHLPRIAGLNQAMEGVMTMAAAPLGALALAVLPLQWALLIDVGTAVLGILPLCLFKLPNPSSGEAPGSRGADGKKTSPVPEKTPWATVILADLREGARFIRRHEGLGLAVALETLVVFIIMPVFSLTPLFVKEHLGGGIEAVAFMELIAGVGIIGGGLLIGTFGSKARRMPVVLVSFAVASGTVALTGLVPPGALSLAAFWWFLSGFSYSTGNAPFNAILQTAVPNAIQGRVFSLIGAANAAAIPLGLAASGFLAEAFGVRAVYIGAGLLSTIPYFAAIFSPSLRRLGREPATAAGEAATADKTEREAV
ncbi:MAG: MFS transporter [Spirochaetaceae bacterium]|nr:MFS transporter [Spirochaetaceae bacterium]